MTVLSARKKRVVTPGLVCHGKVAGWPPTSSFLLFYPRSPIFVSNFLVLSTTRSSLSRLLLCFPPFSSPFDLSTRVSFVSIPFEPRPEFAGVFGISRIYLCVRWSACCLKHARSAANVIFRWCQRGSYRQIVFRISRTIAVDRRPLFIRQISISSSCLLVAYLFFFFQIILCDTIYSFCRQSLLSYQARTNYAGKRAACWVICNLRGLQSSIAGWITQDDPTLAFFSLIVLFCDKSNVTTTLLLVS